MTGRLVATRVARLLALLLAAAGAADAARASNAGRAFGGGTCGTTGCHGSISAQLDVRIEGPEFLVPGETGTYTLRMEPEAGKGAGLNVALFGGGMLSVLDQNTQLLENERGQGGEEITHRAGASFLNQGVWSYDFAVVAPASPGPLTLRAAMNSFNSNGVADSGDLWNTAPDFLVSVVPEPGTGWLLGAGVACLAARRRRSAGRTRGPFGAR